MIKSELIHRIAAIKGDITEKDISLGVQLLIDGMSEALGRGDRIEVRGFGSFSLHYRAPRNAHNPKTGEKVVTHEKYSPHFKPGKDLRDRVNDSMHHPIQEFNLDPDDEGRF